MRWRRLLGFAGVLSLSVAGALAQTSKPAPPGETQRLERMKFDQIARELRAGAGSRIADLGAGGGLYSAALARLIGPQGTVYAVEISEPALTAIEKRKQDEGLTNIEVIQGAEDDPKLPREQLDGVLLVDTYH